MKQPPTRQQKRAEQFRKAKFEANERRRRTDAQRKVASGSRQEHRGGTEPRAQPSALGLVWRVLGGPLVWLYYRFKEL